MTKLLVYIIAIYLIFLFNFNVKLTSECKCGMDYQIEYNGLLWVGLDYYTIWKYDSDDSPMNWCTLTTIK